MRFFRHSDRIQTPNVGKSGLMEPEYLVRDLEAKAAEMQRRAEEMQEQIKSANATATSRDGAVTVQVAPNGALQNIEFSQRATSLSAIQLTQTVMQTVRQAQMEAARKITEIVEPQFGGTDAMDFITGFMPQPDDEQQTGKESSGPQKNAPKRPEPQSGWDDDDDLNDGRSFLR
ncbi:YbaB/EbfC family DNA-binding protein [Saccharopolyspora aridisoli]|uniref:YbaB/EbfC family DNA-binding protein n=1 Tax=Saccharopolyspora aridisoli TaxID=2530385 RepID=A0A4R4UZT1_9PSEU|nr:YbaB/EbfC family nucleoid-associated protein [Saccharopolyspora aridisoli]TDC94804.1 YbaB/EbfC family DNA-binding protein [Saccharopolyspora aridisoli]